MLQDEWAEEALRLDELDEDTDRGSLTSALDNDEDEDEEEELEADREEDEGWEDLGDLLGDEGLDVIEVRDLSTYLPLLYEPLHMIPFISPFSSHLANSHISIYDVLPSHFYLYIR